jgi:acylphosphatase
MVCKRIIFSGSVQGVGFRYTTLRLTQGLKAFGYVKNLTSGDVELWVEGDELDVNELLSRISNRLGRNITETKITEVTPQGFADFEIR